MKISNCRQSAGKTGIRKVFKCVINEKIMENQRPESELESISRRYRCSLEIARTIIDTDKMILSYEVKNLYNTLFLKKFQNPQRLYVGRKI